MISEPLIPTVAPAQNLDEALANARGHLLGERCQAGHWEGELSSSALSTATALFALHLYCGALGADGHASELTRSTAPLVAGGVDWLERHQNPDGGWGDTLLSVSNISTTALCWAALSAAGSGAEGTVAKAARWLTKAAGDLSSKSLSLAIQARYGSDRTFSVPILTMCALAGCLGKGREAWRTIPALPFELAACPQQWFRWLRLPVVSYALPALIAIGQVGRHHRPSRNPLARLARALTRKRTLRVLAEIQPRGGGFLEATPLTSFVLMSLVGSGECDAPAGKEDRGVRKEGSPSGSGQCKAPPGPPSWGKAVAIRGAEFLVRSVRPDGSWPIDTNLATWLTTLSVNALGDDDLPSEEQFRIREWLLGQQYQQAHPYTGAPPGAWAWTDLPGGVPDADDTAGALLALRRLGEPDERVCAAAAAGLRWLLDLQNSDGGMPTFCRGWGLLPFDRSGADLTAHALLAYDVWQGAVPADLSRDLERATAQGLRYLKQTQRADGSWVPLWFGNQHAPEDENPTYGTARVLPALLAFSERNADAASMLTRGMSWLLDCQRPEGGWGGAPGVEPSLEETGLALHALALVARKTPSSPLREAVARGAKWLLVRTENGTVFAPSPIGFYFARLWYFERLYPVLFTVGGLSAAQRALP